MSELHGFLDHLRENLAILDEQIENARVMSKSKAKGSNALQWTKTLRDLLELRNATMDKIKAHLLGRDETGTINEPPSSYADQDYPQTMFERYFHELSKPMSIEDLKIKCEKCGIESETTETRQYERYDVSKDYRYIQRANENLCDGCYDVNLKQLLADVKDAREKNGWNR